MMILTSIIILFDNNNNILLLNNNNQPSNKFSLKNIFPSPVEYSLLICLLYWCFCAVSLDLLMLKCVFWISSLDWSLGYWTEWNPLHPCCVLHHQKDQSHWWDHSDSQPQPWRAQWRFWNQIQYFQWR